jgi:hypothetical protein
MIFSIQRYLEDHFNQRRFEDPDSYAVELANLYDRERSSVDVEQFLGKMARVRTAFFRANPRIRRREFEERLVHELDRRFAPIVHRAEAFPGGLDGERARLRRRPRRISTTLDEFRHAVEAKSIDVFWTSRRRGELRDHPEQVGQALLALFLAGVLSNPRQGLILREVKSGVGFVDVMVLFSATPHLVELKILTGQFSGPSQLSSYMRTERRREGWLVVLDARPWDAKTDIPHQVVVPEWVVRVLAIDINPQVPSRR